MQGYDIVGDVHGCADALRRLLERLDYREKDGVYSHESRIMIFLGDIIDRGPRVREALHIVRNMVDNGHAQMVMGNHEYNAIGYFTAAPEGLGREHLRSHNSRHNSTIKETLAQFADYPEEWQSFLQWFMTLPIFLELDGFRAVHACWDEYLITEYKEQYGTNKLSEEYILASGFEGSIEHLFMDRLTRGTDMPLPEGRCITSTDGYDRRFFRTKFWSGKPLSYGDVVFQPDPLPQEIIEMPISEEDKKRLVHYPKDAPPVFVGHYWLDGRPRPLTPNVACLDFSAVKRGRLAAYRYDGEQVLDADKFIWVYNDVKPLQDTKNG